MTSTTSTVRRVATAAAFVAAGAVAATVLTGVATAGPAATGGAATTASDTADSSAPAARRGMMRDVLHGSFTIATDSGTAVVDVQRGEVTAASATSVTVTSSDGFTATYAVDADTLVRRDRADAGAADLVVGDTAMVRSTADTADVVRALSPDAVARLKDRLANGRQSRGGMGGMGSGMSGMGLGTGA